MSRYTKISGDLEYAYGFDYALGGYFFTKYDTREIDNPNDPSGEGIVFNIGSKISLNPHPRFPDKQGYANSEIAEIVREEERLLGQKIMAPDHWDALTSDLPF